MSVGPNTSTVHFQTAGTVKFAYSDLEASLLNNETVGGLFGRGFGRV